MSTSNGRYAPSIRPDASLWAYPWDLVDEGISLVADRVADSGCTSVSVATAYHSLRALCPHNPARAVVHAEGGAIYVPTLEEAFDDDGIVPFETQDFDVQLWPRLAHVLKSRNVGLRAWAVLTHNSRLGSQNPFSVVQNVYGDRYPFALCPANPNVRRYILGVCKSIAAVGVFETIELESLGFMGLDHSGHHAKAGLELDTAHKWLLSLCFCPHCTMAMLDMGVDIESVIAIVRQRLRVTLSGEARSVSPDPMTALAEILGAETRDSILEAREQTVISLLEEISQAVRPQTRLSLMVTSAMLSTGAGAPIRVAKAANWCDELLVQAFAKTGVEIAAQASAVTAHSTQPVTVGLQTLPPQVGSSSDMSNAVQAALGAGAKRLNFYHYGLMPLDRLAWIKSALGNQ